MEDNKLSGYSTEELFAELKGRPGVCEEMVPIGGWLELNPLDAQIQAIWRDSTK